MNSEPDLRALVRSGATLADISKSLGGVPKSNVSFLLSCLEISIRAIRKEVLLAGLSKVASGTEHIYQIRQDLNCSPRSLYERVIRLGQEKIFESEHPLSGLEVHFLREGLGKFSKPLFNEYVSRGLPVREIARISGRPIQEVEQYIKGSGQYPVWKNAKETAHQLALNNQNQLKLQKTNLVNLLSARVNSPLAEQSPPEEQAEHYLAKYVLNFGNSRLDKTKLHALLVGFFRYQQEGKKPNLARLASVAGFPPLSVYSLYYLGRLGLVKSHPRS